MHPDHIIKCDKIWNDLFESPSILKQIEESGSLEISRRQFEKLCGIGPKEVIHFSSAQTVPNILKLKKLDIVQNKTSDVYLIGHFNSFISLDIPPGQDVSSIKVEVEDEHDTLSPNRITDDSSAILVAYHLGILSNLCACEQNELMFTKYGDVEIPNLSYAIKNICDKGFYSININKLQFNIGAVFESSENVINVVTKIGTHDDFDGKQLFYPFCYLKQLTEKNIINVVLMYSSGSYYAYIFNIKNPNCYNSFELERVLRFDLFETISVNEIQNVVENVEVINEPDAPFPQADRITRILDCVSIIGNCEYITSKQLACEINLKPRQGLYYGNACVYLGLATRMKMGDIYRYSLSAEGRSLNEKPYKEKMLKLVELIARHKPFNFFLKQYLQTSTPPTKEKIADWLAHNTMKGKEQTTITRRAGTVCNWIEWVIGLSQ